MDRQPATAQWFANRDLGHGTGSAFVHCADPVELLAYIHEKGRGEATYVLDPSALNDDTVSLLTAK